MQFVQVNGKWKPIFSRRPRLRGHTADLIILDEMAFWG